jgi:hypothetical protein
MPSRGHAGLSKTPCRARSGVTTLEFVVSWVEVGYRAGSPFTFYTDGITLRPYPQIFSATKLGPQHAGAIGGLLSVENDPSGSKQGSKPLT